MSASPLTKIRRHIENMQRNAHFLRRHARGIGWCAAVVAIIFLAAILPEYIVFIWIAMLASVTFVVTMRAMSFWSWRGARSKRIERRSPAGRKFEA